jgi:hypothetical protein
METRAQIRKEVAKAIVAAGENGRSIEARQPERAARLLELMAEGRSWRSIVEEEKVDWYTLVGLRARHRGLIDKRKEIVAQDAMELIEGARMLQQEKMKMLSEDEGALRRTNLRDLAMSYGIYADKFFMATDGNRVTIEHKTGAPSIEDARKAIEEARAQLRAGSVEVAAKDVTPKQ